MTSQRSKCEQLEALHQGPDAFVIPNPWDAGSAKVLQSLGFEALATTSAGFAQTLGRVDGQVSLTEKLEHCRLLASVTDIPISVDFEDGFANDPASVATNIRQLAETGVAGCSIEDFSRVDQRVFDFELAGERMQAAVEAVAALDMPFQLTARAEGLLRQSSDFDEVIKRLKAFEQMGAHVLHAPGLTSLDAVAELVREVERPVNVLTVFLPGVTVAEIADAGARRISLGSALANLSMAPVIDAGREMIDQGSFGWTANLPRDLRDLLTGTERRAATPQA